MSTTPIVPFDADPFDSFIPILTDLTQLLAVRHYALLLLVICALTSGCTLDPGQGARYGVFGGGQRASADREEPFLIESTEFGVRWFPTYVRFAPDDSNLLVSLCHTKRTYLCRIARYHIKTREWEILPYEAHRTYRWPVYSRDGKWIVYSTAPCDQAFECRTGDVVLTRMSADGARVEQVADVIARDMSFSGDGKKLIYWRYRLYDGPGRRATMPDIYVMDWGSRIETQLTRIGEMTSDPGEVPIYIDDGSFVFSARFEARSSSIRKETGLFRGRVQRAGASPESEESIVPLWLNSTKIPPFFLSGPFDVTPEGNMLYRAALLEKRTFGEPLALTIRPPQNGLPPSDSSYENTSRYYGKGAALFLRSILSNSEDVAVFDIYSCFAAAISSDGKLAAFISGSPVIFHPDHKWLGIIRAGEAESRENYIDWPRLELRAGQTPVINR